MKSNVSLYAIGDDKVMKYILVAVFLFASFPYQDFSEIVLI